MTIALPHKLLQDMFSVDQLQALQESMVMKSPTTGFDRTGKCFHVDPDPEEGLILCYEKDNVTLRLSIWPSELEKALAAKYRKEIKKTQGYSRVSSSSPKY
jgi:hypothetical protein